MALCAYCKAETELYDGGVPICVQCSNAREAKRKPPASEHEIRTTLLQHLTEATKRNHEASRELAVARSELMKAHNRLNDYLSRGIVPEDLKKNSIAKTAGK
jgi:hypothetical protein